MAQNEPGQDTTTGRRLLQVGAAAPVLFVVAVVVAGLFEPGYSHTSQFVSELGAVGAAHPKLFSFGGLFLPGLLTVVFAFGMYLLVRPNRWLVASSLLAALAGFGRMTAPLFPCDPGCVVDDMSFAATMHALFGFTALASGTFAPLMMAMGLRTQRRTRLFSFSVGLGGWPLVLVFFMFGVGKALGFVGVIQRLILAAFYIWVVAVALSVDVLEGQPSGVERPA
ncbi:MAG: DUF998 domain-containing protein [Gemmatimonadetes bacterium]|nr:DUF998 domain-containing protein [Gemmatimonadota bacterium]